MKPTYTVLVGNLGNVGDFEDYEEALACFEEYASLSRTNYGRVANEPVTLLREEEIIKKYNPPQENHDHE